MRPLFLLYTFAIAIFVCRTNGKARFRKRDGFRKMVKELRLQLKSLKEEIDRLKILKQEVIAGARGPRGFKGDSGLRGLPGYPGRKGEPGQRVKGEGLLSFELPNCASDEFLTSNGKKLFCVKLDLKSLNVKDSSNARQPFPPNRAPNPTVSPEERRKMTVFEKRGMIQTIHGDTWDVGVVQHEGSFFLFSSYLGRDFTVYKWFQDVFSAFKSFPITLARHWTTFVIDGNLYVAVASGGDRNSPLFKFVSSTNVVEYQKINVKGVFNVKSVYIGKQLFLIYTVYNGPNSHIYRWHSIRREFVEHQTIKAFGGGVETFRIGNKVFLAFTAMEDGPYVSLYYFDSKGSFTEYLVVHSIREGYSLHHMAIGQDHFLAVARTKNQPAIILQWDGKTFRPYQAIPILSARSFSSITSTLMGRSKEETYLAVASKSDSAIYFFDEKTKVFIKLQEMDAILARDVDFFSMNRHVYLVVSVASKTNIYRGILGS